jgi:hypothetical protein
MLDRPGCAVTSVPSLCPIPSRGVLAAGVFFAGDGSWLQPMSNRMSKHPGTGCRFIKLRKVLKAGLNVQYNIAFVVGETRQFVEST